MFELNEMTRYTQMTRRLWIDDFPIPAAHQLPEDYPDEFVEIAMRIHRQVHSQAHELTDDELKYNLRVCLRVLDMLTSSTDFTAWSKERELFALQRRIWEYEQVLNRPFCIHCHTKILDDELDDGIFAHFCRKCTKQLEKDERKQLKQLEAAQRKRDEQVWRDGGYQDYDAEGNVIWVSVRDTPTVEELEEEIRQLRAQMAAVVGYNILTRL